MIGLVFSTSAPLCLNVVPENGTREVTIVTPPWKGETQLSALVSDHDWTGILCPHLAQSYPCKSDKGSYYCGRVINTVTSLSV